MMLRYRSKRIAGDAGVYAKMLEDPQAHAKALEDAGGSTGRHENKTVGYGRPPIEAQFKSGKSGNPRGRPKGSRNLRSDIEKIFTDKITLREGRKIRRVTRLEAVLMTNLNKALKGDKTAIRAVCDTAKLLNLMDHRPEKLQLGDLSSFSDEELEELKRLLEKANARIVPK